MSVATWLRGAAADERLRFLVIGGANTVFSTALFIVFDLWFGARVPSVVPLLLAWAISVVCVFFLHRRFTFRVRGHVLRDLGRFVLVNSGTVAVNAVLLAIVSDWLGWPRIPWQLAITAVMVVASFVGHKYFSFRRSAAELAAQEPERAADE